jgi:O-acetyl-ADP-ribose deacetylase (regulator of RNase III)
MDVFWANASPFSLPSSQRVEVLVHDGTTDFSLWPGPGPDRVLLDAYGPELREVLTVQRQKHGGSLKMCEVARLHPGKLHSNYLLWAATRGSEVDARQAPAPSLAEIEQAVIRCLETAASNGSVSIAFGAFGDGPSARPPEERLAAVVRAAHKYYESCVASGRSARLEIVRVCDARGGVTASARRLVGRLAQSAPEVPARVAQPTERTPRRSAPAKTARKATPRRAANVLDANEVADRRVTSRPYDRANTYREGDWFVHARFGVGQVRRVTPEGAVEVLFEDGSTKKMLHARPG